MNDAEIFRRQRELCLKLKVMPTPPLRNQKVGIAANVRSGLQPTNGMRCKVEGNTCGWYIWAGEKLSDDPNFFLPLHVEHLEGWCPDVLPYLALPPGWRFLLAPGQEDVWFDRDLLSSD
jgi:hypothetical protein